MDKNMEYHSDTQTLLGKKSKTYIDTETGEKINVEQITKRAYGQKQFWKIYLMDFLQVLGVLDSKQVDVFVYILENTEQANNTFIGSQRDI
ncbi:MULTISPECIES: replication/maintenance protein RepL, partial [Priestia]